MEQSPPSLPDDVVNRKSKWPAVFGIIGIVFGAFGILGIVAQLFGLSMNMRTFEVFRETGLEIRESFEADYRSAVIMGAITAAILGVILLVGGILLLKRKKAGALVLKIWAVLKLTVGMFVMFKAAVISNEFVRLSMKMTMGQTGDGEVEAVAETVSTFMEGATVIGYVFNFIWLAILPILLLVWLNRAKSKVEMAAW